VIVQPALLISLHAGVSIPLRRCFRLRMHQSISARAEGVIFLVGNDVAAVVELEARGAEMVAILISEQRLLPQGQSTRSCVREPRRGKYNVVDEQDALLAFEEMMRLDFLDDPALRTFA